MRRKLAFAIICYFTGVCLYLVSGAKFWFLISPITAVLGLAFIFLPNKRIYLLTAVVFLCLGVTVYTLYDIQAGMVHRHIGDWVTVKGRVEPVIREECFLLDVEDFVHKDENIGYRGRLMVYSGQGAEGIVVGDEITAEGQLKVSPDDSYRNYCRGLGAEALLYSTPYHLSVTGAKSFSLKHYSDLVARWVKAKLEADAVPPTQGEIMKGLLLGGREVSFETRERFSAVGISHLLAVSGLHVGIISGMLLWFLKKLGLVGGYRFFATLAILVFFAFMVGLTPSVVRASIMMGILLIAATINRKPDMLTSLFLAAFLLTVFKPYTIYSISFQLSFLACLGIALFYIIFKQIFAFTGTYLSGMISVTLSSQVLTFPLLIHYFGSFAPVSVLANILIVPLGAVVLWLTVAYIILFALHIPLCCTVIWLNGIIIKMMDLIIIGADMIPYGSINVEFAGPKFFVAYYLAVSMALLLLDYNVNADKSIPSKKAG